MNKLERVEQTILAEGDPRVPGNCFQAAVATLTGLPIEAVPHFLLFGPLWWDAFLLWLNGSGYTLVTPAEDEATFLAVGPSCRGFQHAVVVDGDRVLDPHPDEAGLLAIERRYALKRSSAPWDDERGCFGHCDPEGWFRPCRTSTATQGVRDE